MEVRLNSFSKGQHNYFYVAEDLHNQLNQLLTRHSKSVEPMFNLFSHYLQLGIKLCDPCLYLVQRHLVGHP